MSPFLECPPLLKWPGGKRWLADRVVSLARPRLAGTYFEPFLGGGAVFFRLQPARAVLSDINVDLIRTYAAIRRDPAAVLEELRKLRVTKAAYYTIRSWRPQSRAAAAARFLYLNRTAFGGLYRVNSDGVFNVPYGGGERTPKVYLATDLLARAARVLNRASLISQDFEVVLARAGRGDVAYCDPTYTVAHDNNGFVRYNERNFSWEDQRRLAAAVRSAATRGAFVLVSNANHDAIRELYRPYTPIVVERSSGISRKASGRRLVSECLFVIDGRPSRPRRGPKTQR